MASQETTDKDNKKSKKNYKKLHELTEKDIEKHLKDRLSFTGEGNDIYRRYSAYDYCYNCFRDIHEVLKREKRELNSNEKETLCKQLGLFLGTWGMFRNSKLQNCSYKIYEPLIEKTFKEKALWNIDVKDYCKKDTWGTIKKFREEIKNSFKHEPELPNENNVSVTPAQATKIMMVVFGCVPAYDSYFSATLEPMSFGENSLKYIYNKFYLEHKDLLNKKQKELQTVSAKGGLTDYTYTIAKIIDVIGFHVTEEEMKNQKNS